MKDLEFSFGKLALKLLGKGLYSNPMTAISELVANSLDANAENTYIVLDMINKKNSSIWIIDNGIGMSEQDMIEKYIKIGFNKRSFSEDIDFKKIDLNKVMGRKGIGKLAGLYLSDSYTLISKPKESDVTNGWTVDLEMAKDDDDKPQLKALKEDEIVSKINEITKFNKTFSFNNGTIIFIPNVDLTGSGDKSIQFLKTDIANYFLMDNLENQKIYIKVIQKESDNYNEFSLIYKEVNFKNMIYILYDSDETLNRLTFFDGNSSTKQHVEELNNGSVPIKTKIKRKNETILVNRKIFKIEDSIKESNKDFSITNLEKFDGYDEKKEYKLTGWIGIHSSIEEVKNKNELRLYVRNKLALKNILPELRNTQVFSKYIEGEISFDILDDNDLPDIATSNRQELDTSDSRFIFLIERLLTPIVNFLVSKRLGVKSQVEKESKDKEDALNSSAKTQLFKDFQNNFEIVYENDYKKSDLEQMINYFFTNIKGDTIKDVGKIFISHSSEDKLEVNFFYKLLLKLGAHDDEIFYTSKPEREFTTQTAKNDWVEEIKKNLTNQSSFMFYFVTNNFLNSKFCSFEAGAGWATKGPEKFSVVTSNLEKFKNDYDILGKQKSLIPVFPNDKFSNLYAAIYDSKNKKVINIQLYNSLIAEINLQIEHLNSFRRRNLKPELRTLTENIKELDQVDETFKEVLEECYIEYEENDTSQVKYSNDRKINVPVILNSYIPEFLINELNLKRGEIILFDDLAKKFNDPIMIKNLGVARTFYHKK